MSDLTEDELKVALMKADLLLKTRCWIFLGNAA